MVAEWVNIVPLIQPYYVDIFKVYTTVSTNAARVHLTYRWPPVHPPPEEHKDQLEQSKEQTASGGN